MTRPMAFFISVALAALAGCKAGPQKISAVPPAAVDTVDAMHVQCSYAPINWDGRPGPDGLMVLVLLFRQSRALPMTVRGTIEFSLYQGVVSTDEISDVKPAYSWLFQGARLQACQTRTVWGWGYTMRLGWGSAAPTASSVTLLVRYVPEKGAPLRSDAIVIPMGPR